MRKIDCLLEKRWFANMLVVCVGVILYLILAHLSTVWAGFRVLLGYFTPVIGGCIIAYIMNPLANFYRRRVFKGIKRPGVRWTLSIVLTVVSFLVVLALLLLMLIPQLINGVSRFISNFSTYAASLQSWLNSIGLSKAADYLRLDEFINSSENFLVSIAGLISANSSTIIDFSTTAGKSIFRWLLAFVLSIYLLAAKDRIRGGLSRLLKALFKPDNFSGVRAFLTRCDAILDRYIVFNIVDALIVGVINAIFMAIAGMQYIGLVSFIVAVTNLLPTFGPIIGGVLGAFILLMVKPVHALIFIIFTIVLQFADGYIIKPRLFGNTLGVSGLWILIAVIVSGEMFGVPGILLAIPGAAIIDRFYKENFLPMLERRRFRKDAAERANQSGTNLDLK
ncbi:MAG: AI-2E family transporter [Oscillospiraceae bacterium]|nr:AI-2E family transporter [Oscillospiraceae bacterium]